MINALISAAVVFVAILIAFRLPLIGGLLAMFPIKATAMLWSVPSAAATKGVLIGAIGSALFVAAFYLAPQWWGTPYAAVSLWVIAAISLPYVLP